MLIIAFFILCLVSVTICDGSSVEMPDIPQLFAEAESLIAHINQRQNSWKAKTHPRFAGMTLEQKKYLMGVKWRPFPDEKRRRKLGNKNGALENKNNDSNIPAHFDAREQFKECADVIGTIQDQSACGSCWAVSSASVITDRICVASGGKTRVNISALDLLSCEPASDGCNGGYMDAAFDFYVRSGLCTGSKYGSNLGCKPYPWPPVPHPNKGKMHETPRCTQFCENANYSTRYALDKHYGTNPMSLWDLESWDLTKIQEEIMHGGPITASFMVYEDFVHYASGVYQSTGVGQRLGGHAVRMIGWGTDADSGLDFWLIANSWSEDWGEHGYFRIRRGTDECGIESRGLSWAYPELEYEAKHLGN